jgi:DNA-binding IclR family transcriptional regulator
MGESRYTIKSVSRALEIFSLFKVYKALSLTEISKNTGLNKSTVLRFVSTCCDNHFLSYNPEIKKYQLGFMFYVLGSSAFNALDIRSVAHPVLEALSKETNLIAHLGILDNNQVVVLEKIIPDSMRTENMFSHVGAVMPIYCTGLGAALLMDRQEDVVRAMLEAEQFKPFTGRTVKCVDEFLDKMRVCRARGYAMDQQEHEDYVQCISHPIYGVDNRIAAAVSLTATIAHFEDKSLENYYTSLRNACHRVSTLIGWTGQLR